MACRRVWLWPSGRVGDKVHRAAGSGFCTGVGGAGGAGRAGIGTAAICRAVAADNPARGTVFNAGHRGRVRDTACFRPSWRAEHSVCQHGSASHKHLRLSRCRAGTCVFQFTPGRANDPARLASHPGGTVSSGGGIGVCAKRHSAASGTPDAARRASRCGNGDFYLVPVQFCGGADAGRWAARHDGRIGDLSILAV